MKILIAILLIPCFCFSQTAERYVVDKKDSFLVGYEYSLDEYMEPSVARFICDSNMKNCVEDTAAYRRERHYFATISVYKIQRANKKIVGNPFGGYYTLDGCFEDVPDAFVKKAKDLQAVIDANTSLRNKNGANAVYKYVVTWEGFETKYVNAEYGVDIKRLYKKKTFKTNPEAHKFIDEKLIAPIIGGGVNIKMDSILVNKKY